MNTVPSSCGDVPRHIPTISEIVDQMTTRLESNEPDQAEHEALTRALMPLEDHIARRALTIASTRGERIAALTTLAELTVAVRTTRQEA